MKIKDLVWRRDLDFPEAVYADTPIGSFYIDELPTGKCELSVYHMSTADIPTVEYDTVELGKLAARMHFESIVTSCLEP